MNRLSVDHQVVRPKIHNPPPPLPPPSSPQIHSQRQSLMALLMLMLMMVLSTRNHSPLFLHNNNNNNNKDIIIIIITARLSWKCCTKRHCCPSVEGLARDCLLLPEQWTANSVSATKIRRRRKSRTRKRIVDLFKNDPQKSTAKKKRNETSERRKE